MSMGAGKREFFRMTEGFSSFSHGEDAGLPKKMRCLLIEDYTPLRQKLAECLVEEGYVEDSSATGEEGLGGRKWDIWQNIRKVAPPFIRICLTAEAEGTNLNAL